MRAVFLDRDNTLIDNKGDLGDPDLVRLLPGAADAAARLRAAGFSLIVVTNQGGVARGVFTEQDMHAVNGRVEMLLAQATGLPSVIDRFYSCPYHPEGALDAYRRRHPWRKPAPGMLHAARDELGVDLEASWLVGDQPRDILAGRAAGCRTILIGDGGPEAHTAEPDERVASIADAARVILGEQAS